MPVYLLHGFRWPRKLATIHIIEQRLDDAAAGWLVAPQTSRTLLRNFCDLFPQLMVHLPNLRFIEQYDPTDEISSAQPYAYVSDMVHEVRLGVDVDEVRGKGVKNEQWAALVELRDKLCPEEKVAWFVVVCGDEERWAPNLPTSTLASIEEDAGKGSHATSSGAQRSNERTGWSTSNRSMSESTSEQQSEDGGHGRFGRRSRESGEGETGSRKRSNSLSRSMARLLGRRGELKKSRSHKDLHGEASSYSTSAAPPALPGSAR